MWTTRAQCGGPTSTRGHVAKAFLPQLERMADTASPFSKPCHQAPFWKYLYAWRCRSLSSTSSLFSGILCSSVRRRMRKPVTNRPLPPRAHTPTVCVADQGEGNIGERAERVLYFFILDVGVWAGLGSIQVPNLAGAVRGRVGDRCQPSVNLASSADPVYE